VLGNKILFFSGEKVRSREDSLSSFITILKKFFNTPTIFFLSALGSFLYFQNATANSYFV
jgi:hypothetical protein